MSKNTPWWLALIQGLVAVGAGLFLLIDPTAATFLVGLLAAIYLRPGHNSLGGLDEGFEADT